MSEPDKQGEDRSGINRRQLINRGAVGAVGVVGAGSFLAACGGSSSSTTTAASTTAKATGTITIGSFEDGALDTLQKIFIPQFEKETGVKVNYNATSYDAWYQNAKNDGLQKTGAYDVYIMDDNWVPEFAAGKIVQNMTELGLKVNPDILEKGLNQGYWPPKTGPRLKDFESDEPQLYALVINADVNILYFNSDYVTSVPKTWDDIVAVQKAKANPPSLYGWSARGVKGNPIVMTYLPFLNSYGGSFVNDDWTPGFNGPEGVGALERFLSFIPVMPAGVPEFDTDQETQVMLQGKALALNEYTGLTRSINDPKTSKVVGKILTASTPAQEKSGPAIGTFIAGIASGAKNVDGAKAFLEWFTSSKVQEQYALQGGSAAVTKSALTNPAAAKKYQWLPSIYDAVNASTPKPKTPEEPKMEDILGTSLNKALVEAIAAKSGYKQIAQKYLNEAAAGITALLTKVGGYY